MNLNDLLKLKDNQLLENFSLVVKQEREAISVVISHLAEIDRRRLYAREGFSSLFCYCVEKFNFSEEAAYLRIHAARMIQKYQDLLGFLERGEINLTTLKLISAHLTEQNREWLLKEVTHKSKRQVEKLLASYFPQHDLVEDKIRRLPFAKAVSQESAQKITGSRPCSLPDISSEQQALILFPKRDQQRIEPLTERRVRIEFSADGKVAGKIERVRELLRHKFHEGRLEEIFDEVLEFYLEKKAPERKIARMEKSKEEKNAALTPNENQKEERSRGRIQTRHIPQEIRREVWKRDGGQCCYQAADGRRCEERGGLELEHIFPWSLGGGHDVQNLELLCRTHNQWRAFKSFGERR
jgi:hypothetical protein